MKSSLVFAAVLGLAGACDSGDPSGPDDHESAEEIEEGIGGSEDPEDAPALPNGPDAVTNTPDVSLACRSCVGGSCCSADGPGENCGGGCCSVKQGGEICDDQGCTECLAEICLEGDC
ncbi:MAG: hypothetical protein AAGA54_30515 [Myxococcota bacterium]